MGRLWLALIVTLLLILGAGACGKKGPPVPPSNRPQALTGVSR
jgi:predicted small lipoprotein YifL